MNRISQQSLATSLAYFHYQVFQNIVENSQNFLMHLMSIRIISKLELLEISLMIVTFPLLSASTKILINTGKLWLITSLENSKKF